VLEIERLISNWRKGCYFNCEVKVGKT